MLIFVSSRRQTRLTALDLIAYLATEDNPKQWLHHDERQVRGSLWLRLLPVTFGGCFCFMVRPECTHTRARACAAGVVNR